MIKTQIQVPEALFAEVKKLACRREWSLAETFCRGAELLLETSVDGAAPASKTWQPPTSDNVGCKGLTAEQLRDLAVEDVARSLSQP